MFTKLQGKVKGYEFNDEVTNKTAFVGPNQSGKTSRLEGVVFALEGKRIFGKTADLEGPDREAPRATMYGVEGVVPVGAYSVILPATGLLALGPSKLREAIAARFGADVGDAALGAPAVLTERQAGTWKTAVDSVRAAISASRTKAREPSPVTSLDILVDMPGWCRSAKMRFGKEKTALEARITSEREAIAAMGAAPELAPDLEAGLLVADAWERTSTLRLHRAALEQDADRLSKAVGQLQLRIDAVREPTLLENERTELTGTLSTHDAQRAVLTTLRGAIAGAIPGCCPICQGPFDTAIALDTYDHAIKTGTESLAAVRKRLDEVHHALTKMRTEHSTIENERIMLSREHARLEEGFKSVEAGLQGAPTEYNGPTQSELRAALARIRDAVARRAATERDAERLESIKLEQDATKVVESEAGKRLRDLLAPAVEAFNLALASACALTSSRCYFDIEECRFFVVGKDEVHRAVGGDRESNTVSGAEWSQLNLALARAWAAGDGARAVLVVEFERDLAAFDPTNIRAALMSLGRAVDEGKLAALFVSTSRAHELPDGFTLVPTSSDARVMFLGIVPDVANEPMFAAPASQLGALEPATRRTMDDPSTKPRSSTSRSGRTPRPRAR